MNRHVNLVIVHELFLLKRRMWPADIDAAFGQRKVIRNDWLDAIRIDDHTRRGLHRVSHGLHADVAAGIAAHGVAMHAEIKIFLHTGRVQNRDHGADEFVIGLMRQRGRLRSVIIARDEQHATVLAGARVVRMLEHVAAAINAGAFAVPHGEHAVVPGLRIEIELLCAPHRRCGELFVDARHKRDVRFGEMLFRLPRVLINRAQWRAAVARQKSARVQARFFIDLPLQHHQTQQRVRAVHVNAPGRQREAIIKGHALDGLLNSLR